MSEVDGCGIARTIVLVGLMGAGKSSVGRRLAERLGVGFADSDDEIVEAANMPIPEIFERFGEQYFRDGERRVLARLLSGNPIILATGGGAFLSPKNRALIADKGVSVWIKADIDTLWDRVRDKPGRPLLETADPKATLQALLNTRYPIYETADITVESGRGHPHEAVVQAILNGLQVAGYFTEIEDSDDH